MAVIYNTNIVLGGLVMYLDAANQKSYPGTGTAWQDISNNGNNGTLVNGVSYSTNNGGLFTFDGVEDYVSCGNDASVNFGDGDFTVSIWFRRFANATTNSRLVFKGANGDTADLAGFTMFGSDSSIIFGINPSGARVFITPANYVVNEWVNAVGVLERGVSMRGYKNSVLTNSAAAPTGSVSGSSSLLLANGLGSSLYWPGEIATFSLYNRALTDAEIQQNFNATKARFGL